MRVMIDLETMGLPPDGVICTIGIVTDEGNEVEIFIDWVNHSKGEVNLSTVAWWLEQSQEARSYILDFHQGINELQACEAIIDFLNGCGFDENDEVWCNSPNFDSTLLESMFSRNGLSLPWKFWQLRDFRTVRSLFPNHTRPPVAHTALGDAKSQLIQLECMLAEIRGE